MPANILVIQCDSMDGRVMGCMGHGAASTPNLDRLAARGVLFRNTYCNSPQCVPSRASMWSGRYTHHTKAWNNYRGLSEDDRTWQTDLAAAGYRLQTFGKTDYLSGAHTLGNRVSAWTRGARTGWYKAQGPRVILTDDDRERVHQQDWADVDAAVAWLRQLAASSRPFTLYVGLRAPHPVYRTSQHWLGKIAPAAVTLPPLERHTHPVMQEMRARQGCGRDFPAAEILAIRRTYFAMIAEVDAMVGQLLGALDELALTDSTYVLFLSDHGDMAMEHQQRLKNAMYEASVRVPLIIAGPGVRQGATVEDLVSLVDLYPTLLDLAGLPPRDGLDGHSLWPELSGRPGTRPGWVFSEYHSNFSCTGIFMLRRGEWKYIAYPGYAPQLFNLRDDPDEIQDLAAVRVDIAEQMDAQLRQIVDYHAIDAEAKQYDKASFCQWRDQLGASYPQVMRELFPGWSTTHDRAIDEWLGPSRAGSPGVAPT